MLSFQNENIRVGISFDGSKSKYSLNVNTSLFCLHFWSAGFIQADYRRQEAGRRVSHFLVSIITASVINVQ